MNDFKYALVEVMGRQKVVGEISETTIAGAPMLRVDVPNTSRRKGFTRFFAPGALWGITPLISKEEMETLAEALDVVPVEGYSLRVSSPQLTEKIQPREFDLTNDLTYRSGAWDDDDDDDDFDDAVVHQPYDDDEPELSPKAEAAQWAKKLIASGNFVVLDTETTGLDIDKNDEPVSIAVIDSTGAVLLDTLVKPTTDELEIDAGASAVHGIRKENLKDAPSWEIVLPKLKQALLDKVVVIYNAAFDMGVLRNAVGIQYIDWAKNHDCAMLQYAAFYGEWNAKRRSFKWQSLESACKQQGIEIEVPAHTAFGDCLRTLALIQKMAAYEEAKPDAHPF